ncbi:hypothetical protein BuS5_03724 [Desulfosarcina sp. BuS5]|uniref:glycosyltransferase family 39 protein n=1 Tax=Desulfosarcina sp. BuS5 TaxID=933262 RepID=UPI002377DECB|nr:glycosyltransferase family 39 protein [Desulfosarcina sp. BuS5]WDN90753.1 hypothetical protein BuS5_03724 [Desulfosarcina sp. BuS5]
MQKPNRTLLTFIFSFLGVLAIYGTAKNIFKDDRIGIIAVLIVILSPRIFAQSFYNSKDIVFMAAFSIAIYTLIKLLETLNMTWAVLHGIASAFAVDIRIMGVLIFIVTIMTLIVMVVKKEMAVTTWFKLNLFYLLVTLVGVVAFFPFLWTDPVGNFLIAFGNMSKFRWGGSVLYIGSLYSATNLPWHYVPVWLFVTTPPLYSILAIVGVCKTTADLCGNKFTIWSGVEEKYYIILLIFFLAPIVAVILFSSVLYDGWRQLYFIYPAFVLLSTRGVVVVWYSIDKWKWKKNFFISILAFSFCYYGNWIMRAHPLQNVYFNLFVGSDWKNKFELDYWGLGNKEALQFILDRDSTPLISVRVDSATPLARSLLLFSTHVKNRFYLLNKSNHDFVPKYIFTNYRGISKIDEDKTVTYDILEDYQVFYQKKIDGEVINTLYRIKDDNLCSKITMSQREYTAKEFRHFRLNSGKILSEDDQLFVRVEIVNSGDMNFSALSIRGQPIRLSWRFLDKVGKPTTGWDPRKDLPFDIPANGELTMQIPIKHGTEIKGGTLQISIVQEGVFWGHDVGVEPLSIPWE